MSTLHKSVKSVFLLDAGLTTPAPTTPETIQTTPGPIRPARNVTLVATIGEPFVPELENTSSPEFQDLSQEVERVVSATCSNTLVFFLCGIENPLRESSFN